MQIYSSSRDLLFSKSSFVSSSEEKELLRLTNPDNIRVEATYRGPRMSLAFRSCSNIYLTL